MTRLKNSLSNSCLLNLINLVMLLFSLDKPGVPQSVRAINVQAKQVTITWKSPKCEIDNLICEVHLIFDGAETVVNVVSNA